MALEVDREFVALIDPLLQVQQNITKPKVHDVEGRRALFASMERPPPVIPETVTFNIVQVKREDGSFLPVYHFKKSPASQTTPTAAVLHMHGGGLIALSPEISIERLSSIVYETSVQAFSVDYRLAPEHPYPTALDDCWTALEWIHSNGAEYGVDSSRIAVMGESAGGGLAAALALRAREVKLSPPISRQILSSPMLDDRTNEDATGLFKLWDKEDNLTAWTAYLGGPPGGENVPIFAAPGRLTDASGLPRLYMDTSQLDIFVKENLSYAQKFIEAGVEVEVHVYPGLPHGFDSLMPSHSVSKQLEENRKRLLRTL